MLVNILKSSFRHELSETGHVNIPMTMGIDQIIRQVLFIVTQNEK